MFRFCNLFEKLKKLVKSSIFSLFFLFFYLIFYKIVNLIKNKAIKLIKKNIRYIKKKNHVI